MTRREQHQQRRHQRVQAARNGKGKLVWIGLGHQARKGLQGLAQPNNRGRGTLQFGGRPIVSAWRSFA